jgi:hypothetical protein
MAIKFVQLTLTIVPQTLIFDTGLKHPD